MRAARWIGRAGEITETPARMCTWCEVPHWHTRADHIRRAAGAPMVTHMCDRAAEKFMADAESLGNGEMA